MQGKQRSQPKGGERSPSHPSLTITKKKVDEVGCIDSGEEGPTDSVSDWRRVRQPKKGSTRLRMGKREEKCPILFTGEDLSFLIGRGKVMGRPWAWWGKEGDQKRV